MTRKPDSRSPDSRKNRQIIGLSLSPEMAREVKEEAARRGTSIRKMFEELWGNYKKKPKT
jgi:cyclopropane fatty-acyl-phospholipid synthase-like methyltransferase